LKWLNVLSSLNVLLLFFITTGIAGYSKE